MRRILERTPSFRRCSRRSARCEIHAKPRVHYATRFAAKGGRAQGARHRFSRGVANHDVEVRRNARSPSVVRPPRRDRRRAGRARATAVAIVHAYRRRGLRARHHRGVGACTGGTRGTPWRSWRSSSRPAASSTRWTSRRRGRKRPGRGLAERRGACGRPCASEGAGSRSGPPRLESASGRSLLNTQILAFHAIFSLRTFEARFGRVLQIPTGDLGRYEALLVPAGLNSPESGSVVRKTKKLLTFGRSRVREVLALATVLAS